MQEPSTLSAEPTLETKSRHVRFQEHWRNDERPIWGRKAAFQITRGKSQLPSPKRSSGSYVSITALCHFSLFDCSHHTAISAPFLSFPEKKGSRCGGLFQSDGNFQCQPPNFCVRIFRAGRIVGSGLALRRNKMVQFTGGCSCGDVRYTILDTPMFTHACHCRHCQIYTASAFVVHSPIETTNFVLNCGDLMETTGPSGSGGGHTIKRCGRCGDQIYSHISNNSKIAVLKTTTLDEANRFPPQAHIYVQSKLNWVELGETIPQFDEFYDREEMYPTESLARRKAVE